MDLVFAIIAILCFLAAAWGTYRAETALTALGWIGLIFVALILVV